jgi:hypothetical protein
MSSIISNDCSIERNFRSAGDKRVQEIDYKRAAPENGACRGYKPIRPASIPARGLPSSFQKQFQYRLELVFGRQLQLAHGASGSDAAEGGRTKVQIRVVPVGVIESIECLKTDIQMMLFVVRHQDRLV